MNIEDIDVFNMADMSLDTALDVDIIEYDEPQQSKKPTKSKPPKQFTAIEHQIMDMLAEGTNSAKVISTTLGIPQATINRFLARDDVKKHAQELIDARNTAIKAYLPTLLMGIIEARLDKLEEDPEASLANASKKDIVDIARVVNELIKTSDSATSVQDNKLDAFSAIYAQINNIQTVNNNNS